MSDKADEREQKNSSRRILTAEEVRRMVKAAESQRDLAIMFVLCESGVMPEELLPPRLKGVELGKYGAELQEAFDERKEGI